MELVSQLAVNDGSVQSIDGQDNVLPGSGIYGMRFILCITADSGPKIPDRDKSPLFVIVFVPDSHQIQPSLIYLDFGVRVEAIDQRGGWQNYSDDLAVEEAGLTGNFDDIIKNLM